MGKALQYLATIAAEILNDTVNNYFLRICKNRNIEILFSLNGIKTITRISVINIPINGAMHPSFAIIIKLKKEFGNDITFWGGGSNTREILNRGTIEDVKNDVKRRLEIFAPGGGFVFNPIHNIMPDVPPQNVVAMFEAIDEFYK